MADFESPMSSLPCPEGRKRGLTPSMRFLSEPKSLLKQASCDPSRSAFQNFDTPQGYQCANPRPTINLDLEPKDTWKRLETTLRETTGIFPPLQSAIHALASSLDIVQEATQHRKDYAELALNLLDITMLLKEHLHKLGSNSMSDCVANFVKSIEAEVAFIRKKKDQSLMQAIIGASEDAERLVQSYRRIDTLFRRLQTDAILSTWSIVDEERANILLEGLLPVKLASYDSALPETIVRHTCTKNTRKDLLSGLNLWSNDPEKEPICWMNGMAGTGKTTIACSLSETLAKHKQLGASFFCTRTLPECRDVGRIIPTVAYQLARYSHPFRAALCKSLIKDRDIGTRQIPEQFERLLKEPLLAVQEAIPSGVVVVIDALDECDNSTYVRIFLDEIFRLQESFAIKFFITSRPEPVIDNRMSSESGGSLSLRYLHEIPEHVVQADIVLYLEEELKSMSLPRREIELLARLAGNLFIYAATAVRYILPNKADTVIDSQERLQTVLSIKSESTKKHSELDSLYRTILISAFNEEALERSELLRVQLVLWTAICAREPIKIETLARLAGLSEKPTWRILQSLRSVLHVSETSKLVSPLHSSFPDFIFAQERSQQYFCERRTHSEFLAYQCFKVMETELRFNICELESSFLLDDQINGLQKRILDKIPSPLSHVCEYWGDYLSFSTPTKHLFAMLDDFLSNRLLFWMEVLNLNKVMSRGVLILQKVQIWSSTGQPSPDLRQLVLDSLKFITSFNGSPASLSTPHLYISALPLCQVTSLVFTKYRDRTRGLITAKGLALSENGSASVASWHTGGAVKSISLSPDGSLIAFGGSRAPSKKRAGVGHTGVLNRHNGIHTLNPSRGHTSLVNSVAFSPDGRHYASGSADRTVCVWNALDGKLAAGPFRQHSRPINSVAFSPDGTLIASGSDDRTVCLWNAENGRLVAGPLRGHTDGIRSVVFSPTGDHIASGASDYTIHVWKVQDGEYATGLTMAHDAPVRCLSYSPDGTQIVSGSRDKTICVWNAYDGALVTGPLIGHTKPINSVAFSPDGKRIISGSSDRTLCVWDIKEGKRVTGPIEGHAGSVSAVAFLPNGTRIVSGSRDEHITVWSTQNDEHDTRAFRGHTKPVNSVAFSPDGQRLASASSDHTICIWNVLDGKLITGPLEGHNNSVKSVAFSPDGSHLVSGSLDKSIRVWRMPDGNLVSTINGHGGSILCVAFSPDGTSIVSGSSDSSVSVWNIETNIRIAGPFNDHTDVVRSATFSPNGNFIVSASHDKTICIRNAQNGEFICRLEGHEGPAYCVAYSPNGKYIASGSRDKAIHLWNVEGGEHTARTLGHGDHPVESIAFSPDCKSIASASRNGVICVWDVESGELVVRPFVGHNKPIYCIKYSPDGTRIASCSRDCSIRVLCLAESAEYPSVLDGKWEFQSSGWVRKSSGEYLFWVPQHLRSSFPRPRQSCVIGSEGCLQVDYTGILLGENWSKCYVGQ